MTDELRGSLSGCGEGYGSNWPPALDDVLGDLRLPLPSEETFEEGRHHRLLDYTRSPEQTDRGYVAGLLKQADDMRSERMKQTAALRVERGVDGPIVDDADDRAAYATANNAELGPSLA